MEFKDSGSVYTARCGEERSRKLLTPSLPHTLLCVSLIFACYVLSCSVLSDSLRPHDCSPPGSSVHGDSPTKNTGVGCHFLLQDLPNPGIEPRSPALQADSLPAEPQGSPKETRLCSSCGGLGPEGWHPGPDIPSREKPLLLRICPPRPFFCI